MLIKSKRGKPKTNHIKTRDFQTMQFKSAAITACSLMAAAMHTANAQMVKMCLFYKPSGHARTDPILVSGDDDGG